MIGRAISNEPDAEKEKIASAQCSIVVPAAVAESGAFLILLESHGGNPALVKKRGIRIFSPAGGRMTLTSHRSAASVSGCQMVHMALSQFCCMHMANNAIAILMTRSLYHSMPPNRRLRSAMIRLRGASSLSFITLEGDAALSLCRMHFMII